MTAGARFSAPVSLADHEVQTFDSGMPALDDWLRRRGRSNEASGASRTYVVCLQGSRAVAAYYALAAGGVTATAALPGRFRRNMPDVIPVAILGRLAVALPYQGQGLGRALLRDAAFRVRQAATQIGIRGLLVEALTDRALQFYEAAGFTRLSEPGMMLLATLSDLDLALVDEA